MNGSVGFITEVRPNGTLQVAFDEPTVDIPRSKQINLELAYVLTIHKSQGSEYKLAVVIAHEMHSFMNNRNLLYTAVTRAKNIVILMGDACGAVTAASRVILNKRRTFLNAWLKEFSITEGVSHG